MIDLELIDETLHDLLEAPTTFENCEKIAHLYVSRLFAESVLNRPTEALNGVLDELHDILPAYNKYVETKTRYQKYETVEQMVIIAMQNLCDEITDFVSELYHNTVSEAERQIIIDMINTGLRSAI